jgi:hypothetical protein
MAEFEVVQCLVSSHLLQAARQVRNGPTSPQWEHEKERVDEDRVVCKEDGPVACIVCIAIWMLGVMASFGMELAIKTLSVRTSIR